MLCATFADWLAAKAGKLVNQNYKNLSSFCFIRLSFELIFLFQILALLTLCSRVLNTNSAVPKFSWECFFLFFIIN